jgi:hypothetical protein
LEKVASKKQTQSTGDDDKEENVPTKEERTNTNTEETQPVETTPEVPKPIPLPVVSAKTSQLPKNDSKEKTNLIKDIVEETVLTEDILKDYDVPKLEAMKLAAESVSEKNKDFLIKSIHEDTGLPESELKNKEYRDLKEMKEVAQMARDKAEKEKKALHDEAENVKKTLLMNYIVKTYKIPEDRIKNKEPHELEEIKDALDSVKPAKPSSAIILLPLLVLIISLAALVWFSTSLDLRLAIGLIAIAILSSLALVYSIFQHSSSQRRPLSETKTERREAPSSGSALDFALNTPLIIMILIAGLATVMLIFLPYSDVVFGLPLSIVFGIIDLLVALTIASMIFRHLRMNCTDEALGLPRGSIRALIALSLIIIFAIMAVYMYSQLGPVPYSIGANVTIAYPNGTINANPNGTILIREVSQAQKDFSLQTLTTVSTLVVAIAAFYFGSRSVESAGNALKGTELDIGPELTVEPEDPQTIKQGDPPLTIRVTTDPKDEKIKPTVVGDEPGQLKESDNLPGEYTYTPSEGKETVVLNFALKSKPEVKKSLVIKIENKTEPKKSKEVKQAKKEAPA